MMWFLALLLLCAPGYAQKKPQKWPIESLSIEGLKNYSQQQVLAVAGLKIGQLAGPARGASLVLPTQRLER